MLTAGDSVFNTLSHLLVSSLEGVEIFLASKLELSDLLCGLDVNDWFYKIYEE
jgi:hypothetical protein